MSESDHVIVRVLNWVCIPECFCKGLPKILHMVMPAKTASLFFSEKNISEAMPRAQASILCESLNNGDTVPNIFVV